MTQISQAASQVLRAMSLDALRGFDSAARHLSFTAAADELCLTQSAISKQIKSLEDALGVPLFLRGAKGLSLTPEGRQLQQAARQAIEQLAGTVERLLAPERSAISVTTTPSFASLWLVPRLARFQAEAPEIDVRIDASEAIANLDRDGFDLAIRLSPPGQAATALLRERLMLVAAPPVAARIHCPGDIRDATLLVYHDPNARFGWMSWGEWYRRLGLTAAVSQPCLYFSRYEHVVAAAAEGAGVAIGRTPLILPLLARGELQVVLPDAGIDGMEYQVVIADHADARPAVHRFEAWLTRELTRDVTG